MDFIGDFVLFLEVLKSFENRLLRFDKVNTMSLVSIVYWNTLLFVTNSNVLTFRYSGATYVLRYDGTYYVDFVGNFYRLSSDEGL